MIGGTLYGGIKLIIIEITPGTPVLLSFGHLIEQHRNAIGIGQASQIQIFRSKPENAGRMERPIELNPAASGTVDGAAGKAGSIVEIGVIRVEIKPQTIGRTVDD